MVSASDILNGLNTLKEWAQLKDLPRQMEDLKRRIAELERNPPSYPTRCPKCRAEMIFQREIPIAGPSATGAFQHEFACAPCQQTLRRAWSQRGGYAV